MPMRMSDYPADWRTVSHEIRFKRAAGRCECSGQCGHDHVLVLEYADGTATAELRCAALHRLPHPLTGSNVILTTAHLCECRPLCADPAHLLALCQRCHLRLDAPLHKRNAAETRRQRNDTRRSLLS